MKAMWEKEHPSFPLKCFEIETKHYLFYVMAHTMLGAISFLSEDIKAYSGNSSEKALLLNEISMILQVKDLSDSFELHEKRFFLGDSGVETFEDEWGSLNDLITMETEEFQRTHYLFEVQTEPYLIVYTDDKTKTGFEDYMKAFKKKD